MDYDTRHKDARTTATADDGRALPITTCEPDGDPVGAVLLVPAMATPASFYAPFARWLADRGLRAVTFDYRGTETPEAVRSESADLDRWAADVRAVLDAVAGDAGGLPVTWLGHSLGGQIVPFADHGRLSAIVLVAAGNGVWWLAPRRLRRILPALWYVIAPVSVRVAGYFPGSRLRIMEDLPGNVMRQWSRWCRHPGYLEADHPDARERYAAVKAPLTSITFTDDQLISGAQTRHLLDRYTSAEQVRQRYAPAQLDGRRVGHHGLFRAENVDLWDELVLPWVAGPSAGAVAEVRT